MDTAHNKDRRAPKQKRSRERVQKILHATTEILVREGYEALNTNRVAKEAGVAVGTIYQYFPDKNALVAELRESIGRSEMEAMQAVFDELDQEPIEDAIRIVVEALVQHRSQNFTLRKVLLEQAPRLKERDWMHVVDELVQSKIRDQLNKRADQIRDVPVEQASFLILKVCDLVLSECNIEHPEWFEDGTVVREIIAMISRYLSL